MGFNANEVVKPQIEGRTPETVVRHGDQERAAEMKKYLAPIRRELKQALNKNFRKIRGIAHPISRRKVKKTIRLQHQTTRLFASINYRPARSKTEILAELNTILSELEVIIAEVPYYKKRAIWPVKYEIVNLVNRYLAVVARIQPQRKVTADTPLLFP